MLFSDNLKNLASWYLKELPNCVRMIICSKQRGNNGFGVAFFAISMESV